MIVSDKTNKSVIIDALMQGKYVQCKGKRYKIMELWSTAPWKFYCIGVENYSGEYEPYDSNSSLFRDVIAEEIYNLILTL